MLCSISGKNKYTKMYLKYIDFMLPTTHTVLYVLSIKYPAIELLQSCWQARTAESEYEMNGASISLKATEFTAHFNSKDIDLYIAKLNSLNITDPHNALGVLLTCNNI